MKDFWGWWDRLWTWAAAGCTIFLLERISVHWWLGAPIPQDDLLIACGSLIYFFVFYGLPLLRKGK